eukprot:SAG22_NODE_1922_length_3307_cov_1.973504_3_plen_480_part_00
MMAIMIAPLLAPCLALLLAGSTAGTSGACTLRANTDAHETYYRKQQALTVAACCAACRADQPRCAFAAFAPSQPEQCFLKGAKTMTPHSLPNATLIIVREEPPDPALLPPVLPPPKYRVVLAEHSPVPALSFANAKGAGNSACPLTFNPSYVEAAGENTVGGISVRTDGCKATTGAMSWAPCNVTTGVCGDLNASYQIPKAQGIQDPRVIYNKYDNYFYNFALSSTGGTSPQSKADGCAASGLPGAPGACTVVLSRTKTPLLPESWAHVPGGTYPWHRNGCCHLKPAGQKSFCIWGESGTEGPGSGLGISYTTDISKGKFTQVKWSAGVPGTNGSGLWMQHLGAAHQEVKLEAGAHMVELESGDLLHFYAAATPGWVANGNYTAGYIILDKDDPTRIIQRGSGQFMVPRFEYETLCGGAGMHDPGAGQPPASKCKYGGLRRNVIFMCSATKIGPDRFRLFFGGGDGNVGTGIVTVAPIA